MKDWSALLLCLLLSCGAWMMMRLSRPVTGLVSVQVLPVSNIPGHSDRAAEPVTISARCRASGLELIRAGLSSERVVEVGFAPEDFTAAGGDVFLLNQYAVRKYSSYIFGQSATLESLISEYVKVVFPLENMKKVPVRAVSRLEFRSQYHPLSEMTVEPDSVPVYGDPSVLEKVNFVNTAPVVRKNVRNDVHGIVLLERPEGVRVGEKEVRYSQEVGRCVEIHSEVSVKLRGAPEGRRIVIYPQKVDASVLCEFPVAENPARKMDFYVDYEDFENSIDGSCMIKLDTVPSGVVSWKVFPRTCNCLESAEAVL